MHFRPLCGLINHSCSPTAVVSPNYGMVNATRDINPGDEITISYNPEILLEERGKRYLAEKNQEEIGDNR